MPVAAVAAVVLRYLGEVIDGRSGGTRGRRPHAEAHADAGGLAAEAAERTGGGGERAEPAALAGPLHTVTVRDASGMALLRALLLA